MHGSLINGFPDATYDFDFLFFLRVVLVLASFIMDVPVPV